MALIFDTGPLLALMNREDRFHTVCVELVDAAHESFVVPAATLGELDYWFRQRLTRAAWTAFAEDIASGSYRLEPTIEADVVRAAELQAQYADLGLDFVDAAVIALCERLDEPKVVTLDRRHFSVVRPRHVSSLDLLPH